MKILIINYEFPPLGGGAGNATAYLAKELSQQGNEVVVLTSGFHGLPREENIDGCTIRRVPVIRLRKDRCSPWEMMTFIFSASIESLRICQTWRPDVSIAFFGIPSGVVSWFLKIFYKVPYCVSLRGGDVPGFLADKLAMYHRLAAPITRLIWKDAGQIVANSNRLKMLANRFSPNIKIPIITNGVETDRFKPDISKRNKDKIHILTAGRLSEQKGIEFLLKALSLLKKNVYYNEFALDIVGDGPLRQRLERMTHNLFLSADVTFSGWVDKKDMPKKYQSADIFVLPSLDEGMPNAVLEAMASKLPVITTNILKNEGLIIDGHNGFLVPPEDASMLFDKILLLLKDTQLREEMGQRNFQLVRSEHKWKSIASEYYEHLISIKNNLEGKWSTTSKCIPAPPSRSGL